MRKVALVAPPVVQQEEEVPVVQRQEEEPLALARAPAPLPVGVWVVQQKGEAGVLALVAMPLQARLVVGCLA